MNKNKKGVSPLIATVLLIAFAVALGAVVMNWGRTYVSDTAENVKTSSDVELSCEQDVGIDWVEIGGVDKICYGGEGAAGFIFFLIKNTGTKDIASIGMNIIGTPETNIVSNSSMFNTAIQKGKVIGRNITYDYTSYGKVTYIELMPDVTIGGVVQTCSKHTISKKKSALVNCTTW